MSPKSKTSTLTAWPASEIVMRNPADLKPNPKNPRTHSDEQVKVLRAAIEEFGWTVPCVIDDKDRTWGGHGRVMAALLPPALASVPCVIAKGWSAEKKAAYMLAENRIAETSAWDRDLLREHLAGLNGVFDLAIAGFDAIMLPQFLAEPNAGRGDPDAEVEPPAAPFVRKGDIWMLGTHRIICGDSTDKATVEALLAGARPHLLVSDPPYGVEYDANWRNERARSSAGMGNRGLGAGAVGKVENDDRADWSEAWALFDGDVAYVWCASMTNDTVVTSLESTGMQRRSLIVWAKQHAAIGRSDCHWKHEVCWYAVRKGKTGHWNGDRKQTSVWEIDKPHRSETGHSTQKPVECMARPIRNNSKPGDGIYEPFSGSGTTIIAGEMTGRHVYAIELKPAYVQMAVERWQTFTQKVATLDGVPFDQVKAARAG